VTKLHLVFFSDLHVGSSVGLWPDTFPVDEGGTYRGSPAQRWLLRCYQDALKEVQALDGPVIVVVNGDPIQGVHARDAQLVTSRWDVQAKACGVLLAPLAARADKFYMVRGTEWHEGRAAEHSEGLAEGLGAVKHPTTLARTWWELYLELPAVKRRDRVVVHAAHHIGASSVPNYEATIPLRELLIQLSELGRHFGTKAPDVRLSVRSHRHRMVGVWVPPDMQVWVTPSWQLKTAFTYKRAGVLLPHIGWLRAEWDGREIVMRPRFYRLPLPHIEGGLEELTDKEI